MGQTSLMHGVWIGKLKKSHINKGYEVLKKIEKTLGRTPVNKAKITELTNAFYSLIPYLSFHSNPFPSTNQVFFGMAAGTTLA